MNKYNDTWNYFNEYIYIYIEIHIYIFLNNLI